MITSAPWYIWRSGLISNNKQDRCSFGHCTARECRTVGGQLHSEHGIIMGDHTVSCPSLL